MITAQKLRELSPKSVDVILGEERVLQMAPMGQIKLEILLKEAIKTLKNKK